MGRKPKQTASSMTEKSFGGLSMKYVFPDTVNSSPPPLIAVSSPSDAGDMTRKPFTYHGPNSGSNPVQRLHREFKSLSKAERQRLVEEEAADTDLLARTVHLRFLPTCMLQGELAALCAECGEYLRVRICGNSASAQNWIYGFVEFATREAAEKMLRRSGMELSNGAGKPPLRLKCNAAKQAIVDRVFHDANPATNMSCIFGAGNFSHRTLKEAVDSYFNLKRKEGGIMGGGGGNVNTNNNDTSLHTRHANNNNNTATTNTPTHAAMTPKSNNSYEGYTENNKNNNNNNNDNNNNNNPYDAWKPSIRRNYMKPQESSTFSVKSAPQAGFHSYSASNSDESAGITPLLMHASITQGNAALMNDSFPTPPLYSQSMHHVPTAHHNHHYITVAERASPLLAIPSSIVNAHNAHQAFTSLPAYHDSIIERGKSIIAVSMNHIKYYLAYGEQFYDAVGSLHALMNLLNTHELFTYSQEKGIYIPNITWREEGEEGEEEADKREETLYHLIQLYLLLYLLLALLYIHKNNNQNNEETLSFIHKIVLYCNVIPYKKFRQPPASPEEEKKKEDNNRVEENEKHVDMFVQCDCMHDGDDDDDVMCTFNPISQAFDFFGNIDIDKDDELDLCIDKTERGEGKDDGAMSLCKKNGNYEREINIQSYLLNVLLTVGLSMEIINPVVTRCMYVLLLNRSKEIFGTSLPELEIVLQEGGIHRLRPRLFPQVGDQDFIRFFFESFNVQEIMNDHMFWSNLPPLHMVHCFLPQQEQHVE